MNPPKAILLPAAAGAILLLQAGCMSMSTMQTAQTLAPGERQWTYGTGTYGFRQTDPSDGVRESLSGKYLEISRRQGINDKWDWGARVMIFGAVTVDAKYQLHDGERFDLALGAGLGYWRASYEDEFGDKDYVSYVDVLFPLYLSYEVSPIFTPYLAPRAVWRKESEYETGSQALLGATVGMKVGRDWGLYVEYGYQKDLRSDFSARQLNLAFFRRY